MDGRALALTQSGLTLDDAGRHDLALAQLDRAVALEPDFALAHAGRALALVGLERYDEAIEGARIAQSIDPALPLGHVAMARALGEIGARRKALAAIDEAIRLAPQWADLFGIRSWILLRAGRHAEAERAATHCLALDGTNLWCRNNLAASLIDRGRPEEAEPLLRMALADAPETPALHVNLGTVRLHEGRMDEGRDSMLEALRLDPSQPHAEQLLRRTMSPGAHARLRWWKRAHPWIRWLLIAGLAAGTVLLGPAGIVLLVGWILVSAYAIPEALLWAEHHLEIAYHTRRLVRPSGIRFGRRSFMGAVVVVWVLVFAFTLSRIPASPRRPWVSDGAPACEIRGDTIICAGQAIPLAPCPTGEVFITDACVRDPDPS